MLRLSSVPSSLKKSATLAINEATLSSPRAITRFGLGQSPFPVPTHMQTALAHAASAKNYAPSLGIAPLRSAIASWHRTCSPSLSCHWDTAGVAVGPGSKELLFLLQLALDMPLVLPQGSWVSYAPQALIAGNPTHWVPTSLSQGYRMHPAALDAVLRRLQGPALLLLNSPSNPTGLCYSADELGAIAAVCKQHGTLVLSDEIYSMLNFAGQHASIAEAYPEGTIVTGGISKWAGAGGWRLGTAMFPTSLYQLRDIIASLASETFTAVSEPIQYGAIPAFEHSADMLSYIEASRRIIRQVGGYVARELRAAGYQLPEPEGGFYIMLDASAMPWASRFATSADLATALLEEAQVAVLPGSDFGRAPEELSLRLAFVDFDGEAALAAVARGEAVEEDAFLVKYCPNVVEGVRRMEHFAATS